MTQKILVTKEGKNALTSTTIDDFYLHSDYPLLKVHASGTFTTLIDGTLTISHDLGYRPFALVFSQFADNNGGSTVLSDEYYQHDWTIFGASNTYLGRTKIYDDKLDITISSGGGNVAGGIDGIYYIFKEDI